MHTEENANRYGAALHGAARYGRYRTAQYRTVQLGTVSTAQHRTANTGKQATLPATFPASSPLLGLDLVQQRAQDFLPPAQVLLQRPDLVLDHVQIVAHRLQALALLDARPALLQAPQLSSLVVQHLLQLALDQRDPRCPRSTVAIPVAAFLGSRVGLCNLLFEVCQLTLQTDFLPVLVFGGTKIRAYTSNQSQLFLSLRPKDG